MRSREKGDREGERKMKRARKEETTREIKESREDSEREKRKKKKRERERGGIERGGKGREKPLERLINSINKFKLIFFFTYAHLYILHRYSVCHIRIT